MRESRSVQEEGITCSSRGAAALCSSGEAMAEQSAGCGHCIEQISPRSCGEALGAAVDAACRGTAYGTTHAPAGAGLGWSCSLWRGPQSGARVGMQPMGKPVCS